MKNLLLLFIPIFIASPKIVGQTTDLNGNWLFSDTEHPQWYPAQIPGTVQADLLRLGKIPDPFLKNNEDSIQWVSTKNWQYKKRFTLSSEILKKKIHLLTFKGLDTYAEVFLNDSLIFSANNAFRRWTMDVGPLLKPENELLVVFTNIDSIESKRAAALDYRLPEDARVSSRKPQYHSGWDWAPVIKTMGIWRDVSLISYDTAKISDVFINTLSVNDSLAQMMVYFEVEALREDTFHPELQNKTTGETFSETINVSKGKNKYKTPIRIKNPKLWWPHNLGEPFLYDIGIELVYKGETQDSLSKRIGIRTIELVTENDNLGESFYFKVNGKPVYMKGANYIPQQIFRPK